MAGQRNIDRVGNLCGQAMVSQRRNQADDRARNQNGDWNQIRVAKRRCGGDSVKTTADPFEVTGVPESIQGPRVDAEPERLACAEHSAMPGEHAAGLI